MQPLYLLLCVDALALLASPLLAMLIGFGTAIPDEQLLGYAIFWPILLAWRVFSMYSLGLYDFKHRLTVSDHAFAGIAAALIGVLPGYLLLALPQLYSYPQIQVSRAAVVIDIAFLSAWFGLSRWGTLRWLEHAGYRVKLLLGGVGETCEELAEEVRTHGPRLAGVAGVVALDRSGAEDGKIHFEALEHALAQSEIHLIILANTALPQQDVCDILRLCEQSGAELYIYPELDISLLLYAHMVNVAGIPAVSLQPRYSTYAYKVGKRVLDVALATGLGILASPVLLVAAAAIKLTSPGPVLYSQARVGRNGVLFQLLKLRTMKPDAEDACGAVLANRGDPRVTRVGRWLRYWRIDEVPQLWNVIRGEMSMVGPRPERPEFFKSFVEENPLYERRLLVQPGLTGLAQIHGRYDSSYTHKLRYDLVYINNISLAADLRILLATIQTVLTGKGAV